MWHFSFLYMFFWNLSSQTFINRITFLALARDRMMLARHIYRTAVLCSCIHYSVLRRLVPTGCCRFTVICMHSRCYPIIDLRRTGSNPKEWLCRRMMFLLIVWFCLSTNMVTYTRSLWILQAISFAWAVVCHWKRCCLGKNALHSCLSQCQTQSIFDTEISAVQLIVVSHVITLQLESSDRSEARMMFIHTGSIVETGMTRLSFLLLFNLYLYVIIYFYWMGPCEFLDVCSENITTIYVQKGIYLFRCHILHACDVVAV